MKIVIIGAVAGGATAAARLRRLSRDYEIVLIERGEDISYAVCGLPYYLSDTIADRQDLALQTAAGMKRRFDIDVRLKTEALSVDPAKKIVEIKNLATGETSVERYDKLILSTGARPVRLNIKGFNDSPNLFTLKTIPDADDIKDFINKNKPKSAVILGGGFAGIEVAENLTEVGIKVTIVEKMPQVLPQLDFEMAQLVHAELVNNGVDLRLNTGVTEILENGTEIKLDNGGKIETDMIVSAVGVVPESGLAAKAGFKLGARGHIITDKHFNVIDNASGKRIADIYAVGDVTEVVDPIDGSTRPVPLAWAANRQGKLIADIIYGLKTKPSSILGASVIKVFSLTIASVGSGKKILESKKIPYSAIHAHRTNHAGYYPNATNIALKILYDKKKGTIYGAQAIGREGTEKRIDVIAAYMKNGAGVYDLSDAEVCYAPPYGSAKDPVNILGYIAENVSRGIFDLVQPEEIDNIASKGGYILDVRTPREFASGHINGSVNYELDKLNDFKDKLPQNKEMPIYVTCQVGYRAYLAVTILRKMGYQNLYNLTGGYSSYAAYKYKVPETK